MARHSGQALGLDHGVFIAVFSLRWLKVLRRCLPVKHLPSFSCHALGFNHGIFVAMVKGVAASVYLLDTDKPHATLWVSITVFSLRWLKMAWRLSTPSITMSAAIIPISMAVSVKM